jgi:exodeoxyribonuclease V alpha subunit
VKREDLRQLYQRGILSELDLHFGLFMEALACKSIQGLSTAAALVSRTTREGHICLDLSDLAGKRMPEGEKDAVALPEVKAWVSALRRSSVVVRPGEYKPLVLDDKGRLYLFRYWDYQEKLSEWIRLHAREDEEGVRETLLKEGLARLLPENGAGEVDWQKVSAFTSVVKKFIVISGGPGTGKTTAVAKILALLLEQAGSTRLRVALASPTGKGATRLQEAIRISRAGLPCAEGIREAIPTAASTIHRLLGSIAGSPYFRHNARNRLPVDVLVVDEASMVDMALMSKLVQALPPEARLILLGDKDQLASVEAGAVLGDICDTGRSHGYSGRFCKALEKMTGYKVRPEKKQKGASRMGDCIIRLEKSYRFGSESGIGALSRTVNHGEGDLALNLLREGGYRDIVWKDLPHLSVLPRAMRESIVEGFRKALAATDPMEVFEGLEHFRILCALREGPLGAPAINLLVERILRAEHLIKGEGRWYVGRPVLITRNDYELGLFNGDVGVVLADPGAGHELRVFFATPEGGLRKVHPARLPEHETVYAMTVHKSQGSEFDQVLLLLPDRDSPVLTRELIYTGITSARDALQVWGDPDIFRTAVSRRIERVSGLRDALWGK